MGEGEYFDSVVPRLTCFITDVTHLVSLLTLCGLTSQKTHRGGLGLSGPVHEEVQTSFPYSSFNLPVRTPQGRSVVRPYFS